MPQFPPSYYVSVATRGPWWTEEDPSLRVPRRSGSPAAIWTAGEGPSVLLLAPDAGTHHTWAPLSPRLRRHFTLHAMDRAATTFADDVDQVTTAATAVGATYLVGFADDSAVLREAARRACDVRQVLVLATPGEAVADEQLDPEFMRHVEVSSSAVASLTDEDAARLLDNLRDQEGEWS